MISSKLKKVFLTSILAGFVSAGNAQSPSTDEKLETALTEMTNDFKGVAGVYVYNSRTNKEAGVNADTIFPTASIVKLPILTAIFKKIAAGEYKYNEPLVYSQDRAYGGSGVVQFFKDSSATDLHTAVALMMSFSDNTTALWSQELAGGGVEINKFMEELGLEHTRMNSRTEGRKQLWERYGWGQTTPREMAQLLLKIRSGEVVSKAASEEMYRLMTNSFYTDYALSQIPPYVQTASKQGMVDDSRSELVMVNAPGGDYVFYVATNANEDQSWEAENEAWELTRKISAYLWNYFEPESNWKPAAGIKELTTGLIYGP